MTAVPKIADLSDDDLEAIRRATHAAERRSGGELVCVLVGRCDSYGGSSWRGATLGALAAAGGAALWQTALAGWRPLSPYLPPLVVLLGAALGFLAVAALPLLKRLLVPAEVLDLRVDRRAAAAFLDEEVFDTRERTGVLLFVAFFEHRVRILADSGLERRVPREAWDRIAGELVRGLRAGRTRGAILSAVEACGRVLEEHGVARRPDDDNELPDEPRVHDD